MQWVIIKEKIITFVILSSNLALSTVTPIPTYPETHAIPRKRSIHFSIPVRELLLSLSVFQFNTIPTPRKTAVIK
jgi:hypothetical protein